MKREKKGTDRDYLYRDERGGYLPLYIGEGGEKGDKLSLLPLLKKEGGGFSPKQEGRGRGDVPLSRGESLRSLSPQRQEERFFGVGEKVLSGKRGGGRDLITT